MLRQLQFMGILIRHTSNRAIIQAILPKDMHSRLRATAKYLLPAMHNRLQAIVRPLLPVMHNLRQVLMANHLQDMLSRKLMRNLFMSKQFQPSQLMALLGSRRSFKVLHMMGLTTAFAVAAGGGF
jgi:hypothetical protein